MHYFKNRFVLDLIPLIQIELLLDLGMDFTKHLFIFKVIRFYRGYTFFSVKNIIQRVKKYYHDKNQKLA